MMWRTGLFFVGNFVCLISSAACSVMAADAEISAPMNGGTRTWSDLDGKHHTVASCVAIESDQVILQKTNGKQVRVPIAKLSTLDQSWIAAQRAASVPATSWSARLWNRIGLAQLPDLVARQFTPSQRTRRVLRDAQANAVNIQVSERFLNRLVAQEHRAQVPISDVILGAQVQGQGQTVSHIHLDLVQSDRGAITDLLVTGRCDSRTTSFASPVQLHGHSVTLFSARKRVIAGDDQILVLPTVSAARAHSVTDSITSSLPRLRGRISVRIAEREAARQHQEAEAIAARHAEQRVNRRIDEMVGQWTKQMSPQLQDALARGKARLPIRVVSRSTGDRLHVSLLPRDVSPGDELPAPPTTDSTADLVVQIHAPLLNQALSRADLKDGMRRALASTARTRIVQLVSTQAAAQPHWTLRWSGDHHWVTFTWSEKARGPQAEKQDRLAVLP